MAGRERTFDEQVVLNASRDLFISLGYEGSSLNELLEATGLSRASLYNAFGSKRGLFLAVWNHFTQDRPDLPLLLAAVYGLAPHDQEFRGLVADMIAKLGSGVVEKLGDELLHRAQLTKETT